MGGKKNKNFINLHTSQEVQQSSFCTYSANNVKKKHFCSQKELLKFEQKLVTNVDCHLMSVRSRVIVSLQMNTDQLFEPV